jgi:hypothetical protein
VGVSRRAAQRKSDNQTPAQFGPPRGVGPEVPARKRVRVQRENAIFRPS